MFVDFLIDRFQERAAAPAVVSPAGRCSFGELAGLYGQWGEELDRRGIERGAVIALVGDFSPNAIALFLALLDRGAIVVPHRSDGLRSEREQRNEIAQVEVSASVDGEDRVSFARFPEPASHELYEELRRRRHPGVVGFSSGTSGEPKGAVHDFDPWLATFHARRKSLSTLTFLLFDHLGGVRTMLYALSNGAKIVSVGDRSPETVCDAIERERIELLPATPTFFNLLLLSGAHRRHDLSSLRVISYGAEPMPQTTLDRLRDTFPTVTLQQTYGLIEIGPLRSKSRQDGSLWVKVGGEGVKTRVVDGMLQVRSRSVIMGYLNAPSPITTDGWFQTGDAVLQDGEYFRFLGRESELINVGGEKVYPAEVEGVVHSMEEVETVAVYGKPHGLIGEVVCARVKLSSAAEPSAFPAKLRRYCRQRLERFKVPMTVEVVDEHPISDRFKQLRPSA
jgi:long-chain acyl-CoA synthetase